MTRYSTIVHEISCQLFILHHVIASKSYSALWKLCRRCHFMIISLSWIIFRCLVSFTKKYNKFAFRLHFRLELCVFTFFFTNLNFAQYVSYDPFALTWRVIEWINMWFIPLLSWEQISIRITLLKIELNTLPYFAHFDTAPSKLRWL